MRIEALITADLGHLKAYRVSVDELSGKIHVQNLVDQILPEAHKKLADIETDEPGRYSVRTGKITLGRPAGEQNTLELEIRKRLLGQLAQEIDALIHREDCKRWGLAAGSEVLPRLLEKLSSSTRERLVKTIPSDLTKLDKGDVLARFLA
ncbi:host attachment protein [Verrucomicrobium sp. 3C]|uniref:host attachment protein n=1 Tax=Verrucomicrobium sp. 3C TaxID=1134055 RepID=UPI0003774429|nr:host attachment protein [Verrucomicrobium sp. 3C]